MGYTDLVNNVISTKIFPRLLSSERSVIIRCVIRIIESIENHLNPDLLYNQLLVDDNKDVYILVNMIVPFIEESEKPKLKYLSEIPTKFTNLAYNLGEKYQYSSVDLIRATDYLVNETIPKVIHKLYINWIDIFPDLKNNDGFHSIVNFIPDIRKIKTENPSNYDEILYNTIETNINNKMDQWKTAIYYFMSTTHKKTTYDKLTGKNNLLVQYSDLKNNTKQNWFNAETFYWLSQIHFFNHLLSNRIIYMTAGTGVGKSTHIPKLALYALMAFEDIKEPKIIVTQPRQNPAQNVPGYISRHMGISIEDFKIKEKKDESPYYIQFKHGDDQHMGTSKSHRTIKYVTDQLLFNELLENESLLNENGETLYDIIMIDEAHEHNIRMDLILSVVKKTLELNNKIRLMIISATMEDDEARYRQFFNSIEDKSDENSIYKFNSNIDRRLHIANPLEKNRFQITEHFEKEPVEDYTQSGIIKIHTILKEGTKGDILFFLTGQGPITKVCDQLNNETSSNIIALPLYTSLDKEAQDLAIKSHPKDVPISKKTATLPYKEQVHDSLGKYTRKIILATTIAEASVTIENLKYVIDIGFSNAPYYDPVTKVQTITKVPISKSSHTQRRGRVGRICDGVAYYLYTKEDIMKNKIIASIKTDDLTGDILSLLKDNKNSDKGFEKKVLLDPNGEFYIIHPEDTDLNDRTNTGLFKQPLLPEENIHLNDAFDHLDDLKLIDISGYYTDVGILLIKLNRFTKITIHNKLSIIYAIQYNLLDYIIPIIVFTSIITFERLFVDVYKGLKFFCKEHSDHMCILHIFTKFKIYANKLFICNYNKKIIAKELNEYLKTNDSNSKKQISDLLKKINPYFKRFHIQNKDETTLNENIEKLIEREVKLIEPWCKQYYINSTILTQFMTAYQEYRYNVTEIIEIYKSKPLKRSFKYNSLDLYSKILQILKDSNPRNIGFVNSDGIYQTQYDVPLSIKTAYIKELRKVIPNTCYNKNSRNIFFSKIEEKDDETTIEFVSSF